MPIEPNTSSNSISTTRIMKVSFDSCPNFLVLFLCFQLHCSVLIDAISFILLLLSVNNVAFTIYTDWKQQIVVTFFNCLECCSSTKYLVAKVNDPELGGTTQLFFIKLRGTRLAIKCKILALCLMAFSV